jgi:transcription elongation factor SPT6
MPFTLTMNIYIQTFKYVSEKPVYKFDNAQFLEIRKAEDEGLVEVSMRVEEEPRLMEDIIKNMTNDYVNEFAEAWNDERKKIAEHAARTILFPQVVKWLKEKMANDATQWLMDQCRNAMEQVGSTWFGMEPNAVILTIKFIMKKLDVAPFRRDKGANSGSDDEDDKPRDHARVMAISWGEGTRDSATIVVCLDEEGNVSSRMKLSRMQERDTEGKRGDLDTLLDRIRRFRPDVVVVGGFSLATHKKLLPDIAELLTRVNEDRGRDNDDDEENSYHARRRRGYSHIPKPDLVMVDDDVSRLAMKSARFQKEFPDLPPLGLYCVSLARKLQDATMEYATLYNQEDEIKLLHIHPSQHLLPDEKLKSSLERAFINVVNSSGVDINDAAYLPHRSSTLQFVSGFGPRKANFIISRIQKIGKKLESRADLVTKKIVAFKVFMNSASFIRIKEKHFPRRNLMDTMYDVLDDTRIHPEDYDLARKMAADALDVEGVVDEDPSQHVAELMEDRPERLNLLMLDDYAEVLEKQMNEPKRLVIW